MRTRMLTNTRKYQWFHCTTLTYFLNAFLFSPTLHATVQVLPVWGRPGRVKCPLGSCRLHSTQASAASFTATNLLEVVGVGAQGVRYASASWVCSGLQACVPAWLHTVGLLIRVITLSSRPVKLFLSWFGFFFSNKSLLVNTFQKSRYETFFVFMYVFTLLNILDILIGIVWRTLTLNITALL